MINKSSISGFKVWHDAFEHTNTGITKATRNLKDLHG